MSAACHIWHLLIVVYLQTVNRIWASCEKENWTPQNALPRRDDHTAFQQHLRKFSA